MSVLIFAFRGTNSELIARGLGKYGEVNIIDSSVEAIDELVAHSGLREYTYVLGMGQYSGRDHDRIRIETQCSSRFRHRDAKHEVLHIPTFFNEDNDLKYARGMGNSWCNFVSYRIVGAHPQRAYTFLHVPKQFETARAVRAVQRHIDILR